MTDLNATPNKVLVLDHDDAFVSAIVEALHPTEVSHHHDGTAVKSAENFSEFDLIILNDQLKSESACELCRIIRKRDEHIPIIFASYESTLDSKLEAYGAGGNDFFDKDEEFKELPLKVSTLISHHRAHQELLKNLETSNELLFASQQTTAHIHAINRFINNSNQCKNEESLFCVFFHTLKELGVDGVLEISNFDFRSSFGGISPLESEILQMAGQLPRVYSFGKGRAVFNWSNCRFLVRHVGEMMDVLAMLMDALEFRIRKSREESRLLKQIYDIEQLCEVSKDSVASLVQEMSNAISTELMSLGLVSALCEEEEQHLEEIISRYNDQIQGILSHQDDYNQLLKNTVDSMREENEGFRAFLDNIKRSNEQQDSIDLF
jgi:CheY-like chemotaxis protein